MIRKSIWVNAPPDDVFEMFVDADKMVLWAGQGAELDPVPGGVYRLNMGAAGVFEGRFLTVERPLRVIYEVDPPPGMDLAPSRVAIELAEEMGGTRVNVEHSGLADPFAGMAACGWDHHLARMSVAALGGAPGRDGLCDTPVGMKEQAG